MGQTMGFDFGLGANDACFKRKFRWLLKIKDVSATGIQTLPPMKGARPNVSFKEIEAKHLVETVYYPGRPEWKPITLVLFDLKRNKNPLIEWFKKIYDSQEGTWKPSGENQFKKEATLELYDGCGTTIEKWTFENVWPQTIEFGDLDMGSSEVVTIEVTLRYDRAYEESV
jgi:phage tail-like protein